LHLSRISFVFFVSSTIENKVGIAEFLIHTEFCANPLQFDIYFWFVSETTGVKLITFSSHMLKLVKLGKEYLI